MRHNFSASIQNFIIVSDGFLIVKFIVVSCKTKNSDLFISKAKHVVSFLSVINVSHQKPNHAISVLRLNLIQRVNYFHRIVLLSPKIHPAFNFQVFNANSLYNFNSHAKEKSLAVLLHNVHKIFCGHRFEWNQVNKFLINIFYFILLFQEPVY